MSRYYHHRHFTPLLYHHVTPILPMDHHIYHATYDPFILHGSTSSSCNTSPIYVDHHLLFMQTIAVVTQKQLLGIYRKVGTALSSRCIFMRNKKQEINDNSLILRPHVMKLCRLTQKTFQTNAIHTKMTSIVSESNITSTLSYIKKPKLPCPAVRYRKEGKIEIVNTVKPLH